MFYNNRTYILFALGKFMNLNPFAPLSPLPRQAAVEAHLLGQLLTGPARGLPNLHPLDFDLPANRLVWRAMVALRYLGVPLSVRSVAGYLTAHGQLQLAGGEAYLDSLARGR
jgi:replicative DNA helicase